MDPSGGILLLTAEPGTVEKVAAALNGSERFACAGTCSTLADLRSALNEYHFGTALIDLDPKPQEMLRELGDVVGQFPDLRIVVMAEEMQSDLLLAAMQIGARHFLIKKSIGSELMPVLERLARAAPSGSMAAGSMVTVLSAGGGCGATTIAINIANELACKASSPSLVVDMDAAYGAVSSYLGLTGEYGLADVLRHDGRIDEELVVSAASVFSPFLHVLLSPVSVDPISPVALNFTRLGAAIDAFRVAYRHTVVDAGRVSVEVAAALAGASKLTLLVLQMNLKDLTCARNMLLALARQGVSEDAVLPIVNRYHRRNKIIGLEDARKALGVPFRQLTNDYSSALRSINMGQPLAQAAPRASLRRELQRLAVEVTGEGPVLAGSK